jgi:hypothetical protein
MIEGVYERRRRFSSGRSRIIEEFIDRQTSRGEMLFHTLLRVLGAQNYSYTLLAPKSFLCIQNSLGRQDYCSSPTDLAFS